MAGNNHSKNVSESVEVKCGNCGKTFADDSELALLCEVSRENGEGKSETVGVYPAEGPWAADIPAWDREFYKGCPKCLTDGYLSDVER